MSEQDNDKMNNGLEKVLHEYGDSMHVPPEVMLEYAEGHVTRPASEFIEAHIEKCSECREVLRLARESVGSDEIPLVPDMTADIPAMSKKLAGKVSLHAYLSEKKDKIAGQVASLLIPGDMTYAIRPAITALRSLKVPTTEGDVTKMGTLRPAAFSSEGDGDIQDVVSVVRRVLVFVDRFCGRLMERCAGIKDIVQHVQSCVDDSIDALPLEEDTQLIHDLNAVLVQGLSEGNDANPR